MMECDVKLSEAKVIENISEKESLLRKELLSVFEQMSTRRLMEILNIGCFKCFNWQHGGTDIGCRLTKAERGTIYDYRCIKGFDWDKKQKKWDLKVIKNWRHHDENEIGI